MVSVWTRFIPNWTWASDVTSLKATAYAVVQGPLVGFVTDDLPLMGRKKELHNPQAPVAQRALYKTAISRSEKWRVRTVTRYASIRSAGISGPGRRS